MEKIAGICRSLSDEDLVFLAKECEHIHPVATYNRDIVYVSDLVWALQDARKDSVWREIPDNVDRAEVHYISINNIAWAVPHTRTLPKTPKQELIDKFAEKNALAMKCANLSKEILEAFAKEYEEMQK